jgi:hypothetical protein
MNDQSHAPAALSPRKDPPVPNHRKVGGLQSRSGRCGEETNLAPLDNLTPTGIVPGWISKNTGIRNTKVQKEIGGEGTEAVVNTR